MSVSAISLPLSPPTGDCLKASEGPEAFHEFIERSRPPSRSRDMTSAAQQIESASRLLGELQTSEKARVDLLRCVFAGFQKNGKRPANTEMPPSGSLWRPGHPWPGGGFARVGKWRDSIPDRGRGSAERDLRRR